MCGWAHVVVRSGCRLHRIDPISGCARFVCQCIHLCRIIIPSCPQRYPARLLDAHSELCQTRPARVGLIGLLQREPLPKSISFYFSFFVGWFERLSLGNLQTASEAKENVLEEEEESGGGPRNDWYC